MKKVPVKCPHCSLEGLADEQSRGKLLVCPNCKNQMTMEGAGNKPEFHPLPATSVVLEAGDAEQSPRSTPLISIGSIRNRFSKLSKRSKLLVFAGVIALAFLLWLCFGSNDYAGAMEKVIRLDKEISRNGNFVNIRPKTNEDFNVIVDRIKAYVQKARQLDTSGCPREFAAIYYRHVSAWENFGIVLAEHPYIQTKGELLMEGFVRGFGGDLTGGALNKISQWEKWDKRLKAANAEISTTWRAAENIALKYGARLQ